MDIGENGDGDEFHVEVDDAIEGRSSRGRGLGRGNRGGRGDSKVNLHARTWLDSPCKT